MQGFLKRIEKLALLKQVERYSPAELGGERIPAAELIKERNEDLRKLKRLLSRDPRWSGMGSEPQSNAPCELRKKSLPRCQR